MHRFVLQNGLRRDLIALIGPHIGDLREREKGVREQLKEKRRKEERKKTY